MIFKSCYKYMYNIINVQKLFFEARIAVLKSI